MDVETATITKRAYVSDHEQGEEELAKDVSGDVIDHGLRRGLKGRHFVLIALGSIIGPGTSLAISSIFSN